MACPGPGEGRRNGLPRGRVSLERNGQQLDPSEVQTGSTIENFDLVKTGADGLAEVSVDNPKAPAMTIKVSPRTAFSFELSQLGSKQRTSVGLMSGTISLKVQKLSGSQDMNINLDNAVMGVRGTEFTVTTVPSGDLLLTCRTGRAGPSFRRQHAGGEEGPGARLG